MNDAPHDGGYGAPTTLTNGPFAGWMTWGAGNDPFETLCGPLCFRTEDDGRQRAGFLPTEKHLNGGGVLHGGALMTFADFSLFALAHDVLQGQHAVTVTFNSELMGAGVLGAPVYAEGRVLRETKSMVFVQGRLEQNGQPIMAFSGTLKKIRPR
ncbi:MAG: PaaI family thioesterase [Hyphomonadaceae bacterium]|nr:PaaI family thioesterase [Hyphomonadaceae bacterium]